MRKYIFLLVATFFIFSCSKDNKLDMDTRMFLSISTPSVSNGILCFTDINHFYSYYQYLDSLSDTLDIILEDDYFDIDSFLLVQESNFEGFSSLRSHFYDKTEELSTVDDFFTIEYSHDDIKNSIFNSDGVVKIGSYFYVMFGSCSYYKIPDSQSNLLTTLKAYDKSKFEIVGDVFAVNGVDIISDHSVLKRGTNTSYDNYVYPVCDLKKFPCSKYKAILTLSLEVFGNVNSSAYPDANWIIDWGDNSNPETITSNINNTPSCPHTYSSDGVFNISVTCTYADYNNSLQDVTESFGYEFDTELECANNYYEDYDRIETNDGKFQMATVLYFEPHDGFLWSWSKFSAKTKCFKYNNQKAKWEKHRTNSSVSMNYAFRYDNCQIDKEGSKSKQLRKRKSRRVRAVKWTGEAGKRAIANTENNSHHVAEFPGQTLTVDLSLAPCQ